MEATVIKHAIQIYRQYEQNFFNTLTDITTHDLYMYGEVGFYLCGLKPMVLFDVITALPDYIDQVVRPWMDQYNNLLVNSVLVKRQLYTPEIDGQWMFLLVRTKTTSHLLQQEQLHMSEEQLATLLDYPGRLPRSMDELPTMREVVYYDQHTRLVLTTFASQLEQQQQVMQHFTRYKDTMLPFGLDIA
ncbi:uncharacterized protein BX664DRAFT_338970 [Halteromyces radiatus]|uniref:uncharacterized protein n=1 Tax=Halteromyces radiatus TaxID=101107 RepID=UPI00221F3196|nr:uncharacterized protein BX664DRAFT_338970 [Halteromyces radiatus]KAI8082746.1 hypothetical protein BX664DRAFT_338970 [Halteromyces radiatus]